jgi:sulfatase modifying factor 1
MKHKLLKMKTTRFLLLAMIVFLFLSARKQRTTVYDLRYVEENMCLIPAKTYENGSGDEDISNPPRDVVKVDSFYLFRFEISNGMYRYYLAQLGRSNEKEKYTKALPDTTVWRYPLAYNEPYVDYYFRHPAYSDYPLVGISYEQAIDFCSWLTTCYNAWPERKYKNVTFDLPTKNEWMAAAYTAGDIFPWKGYGMLNKDRFLMGNFLMVRQESVWRDSCGGDEIYRAAPGGDEMGIAGKLNDFADVTVPVNSYWPNESGIYNMGGNVEEMVKEKGITKGGSWRDPGYYLHNHVEEHYADSAAASTQRGFRISMKIKR